MHNEVCYPNGSYFFDSDIKTVTNSIACAMTGSNNDNKMWIGPNGDAIACSSGNLRCTEESDSLKLYIPKDHQIVSSEDGWYKCCLQAGCSDSISLLTYSVSVLIVLVHTVICY